MDPPPPTTTTTTTFHHHHHHDATEPPSSSPTCRQWDDTLPPPKLRMMCSYGGHIIPRPHDKSLCYMGGETRIVVADRHTSLTDLCSRLSATLLNGRQFTLKYQLPTEDLDSLVSVSTDEDLDNMIEEYDRLNSCNLSSKPSRLRLFLFVTKPETAASMGSLLDDAKSETWFVDALNGAGLLPRGLSDSATIDNLLEPKDGESEVQRQVPVNLPDSPVVETTTTSSSFGSSSSSPTMCTLPPIKVKVEPMINQMVGIDEQLSQLNVSVHAPVFNIVDDDRSDQGRMRKPPLPLPLLPVQRKFGHEAYGLPSPDSKHGGAYTLHSPDSTTSDSSIASANYQTKNTFSQDPSGQSNRDTPIPPATANYQIPDDTQSPSLGQDQQQFYQTRPHFIQHQTLNQPPQHVSSYYQQYPLYFLPVTQNHPYGMPLQANTTDAATITSSSAAATPPLYPTKTVIPMGKPDIVTNSVYGTTTPGMIQVPNNQFQQQYMNVTQIPQHPATPLPVANNGNYGYEYAHPTQDAVYYSQHHSVAAPLASQYQTMNPASSMLLAQVAPANQPAPETAKQ